MTKQDYLDSLQECKTKDEVDNVLSLIEDDDEIYDFDEIDAIRTEAFVVKRDL